MLFAAMECAFVYSHEIQVSHGQFAVGHTSFAIAAFASCEHSMLGHCNI